MLGFRRRDREFDDLLLAPVLVWLPLLPAEYQGSIYENQRFACRRFVETAAEPAHLAAAE